LVHGEKRTGLGGGGTSGQKRGAPDTQKLERLPSAEDLTDRLIIMFHHSLLDTDLHLYSILQSFQKAMRSLCDYYAFVTFSSPKSPKLA
jgi:hypothetical protein